MENERSSKVVAIVALCVGVVGLSLGFAAFSSTLTISSSAGVKPNSETFNVDFSTTDATGADVEITTDPVVPTKNPDSIEAANATIDNVDEPTITGLKANFTAPGQSVTYTFYAHNAGEYEAFLNSILINETSEGSGKTKICTASPQSESNPNPANQDLVDDACEAISLSIKVGDEAVTNTSIPSITGHSLAQDTSELVTVTIDYAVDGPRADGNFSVAFGDITLVYDSVE